MRFGLISFATVLAASCATPAPQVEAEQAVPVAAPQPPAMPPRGNRA